MWSGLNLGKKIVLGVAGLAALLVPIVVGALNAPAIQAQDAADWQAKAGGKMAFEVASVKLSKGPFVPPNIGALSAGERIAPPEVTSEPISRCGPTSNSHIRFGRLKIRARRYSPICRNGSLQIATALMREGRAMQPRTRCA